MFPRGDEVVPPHLVFLSFTVVAILQLPAYLVMREGWTTTSILLNELVAILGVPLVFIWLLKFNRRKLIALTWPGIISIVLFILITLGADILIEYITSLSEHFIPLPDNVREALEKLMAIDGTQSLVTKLLLLCLLPAVCEEIFFRGFCQTSLAARWGNTPAILISALIFAMLHGNPWYIHLYFILGIFLGWTYAATGSLVIPIICHMVNNVWTIVINHYDIKFPISEGFGVADAVTVVGCALLLLVLFRIYKISINNR